MQPRTVALASLALLVVAGCTGEPGSPSEETPATPSAGLSIVDGTGSLEDQEAVIDDLDEAAQTFSSAYADYVALYQQADLRVIMRESESVLDRMVSAWEVWKSVVARGGSLGVDFPLDEALLDRFMATVEEWLAIQRKLNDLWDRCGVSVRSSDMELLACMMDNAPLIREGDRLSRQLVELQAQVLGTS